MPPPLSASDRCPVRKVRVGAPRKGRILDNAFLAWLRKLPCSVCGSRRMVDAAHVGMRGMGMKCSDRQAIPLCRVHHIDGPDAHHVLGRAFWIHHNLDRELLIAQLNELYEQEITR